MVSPLTCTVPVLRTTDSGVSIAAPASVKRVRAKSLPALLPASAVLVAPQAQRLDPAVWVNHCRDLPAGAENARVMPSVTPLPVALDSITLPSPVRLPPVIATAGAARVARLPSPRVGRAGAAVAAHSHQVGAGSG